MVGSGLLIIGRGCDSRRLHHIQKDRNDIQFTLQMVRERYIFLSFWC